MKLTGARRYELKMIDGDWRALQQVTSCDQTVRVLRTRVKAFS